MNSSLGCGIDEFETDLASLASRAAINLDDMLLGRTQDTCSILRLAKVFRGKLEVGSPDEKRQWLIDPPTAVIVSCAMHEVDADQPSETIEQVKRFAEEIARQLEAVATPSHPDATQLAMLRDYCVALSRSAASATYSPPELEEVHPYRR